VRPAAQAEASQIPTQQTEPVVAAPEPIPAPEPAPQPPITDHQSLMQAAGIPASEWDAVEYIVGHESSWQPDALNSEGCLGLGQRCPASVLQSDCPDLNAVCQLKHFTTYANSRYGGWWGAYSTWISQKWW